MAPVGLARVAVGEGPGWLAEAETALRRDGAVVLVDTGLAPAAAAVGELMSAEVAEFLAAQEEMAAYAQGHLRHRPPVGPSGCVPAFLGHPAVAVLPERVLGPSTVLSYHGHTVLPGSTEQPVHADWEPPRPEPPGEQPPFMLAVNVAVVPTGERNGSIEVWPGTHELPGDPYEAGSLRVRADRVAARRAERPPVRASLAVGDVLVRDVRTWHRGTRNLGDTPRPILWLLVAARSLPAEPSAVLEESVRADVEALPVSVAGRYLDAATLRRLGPDA